MSSGRSLTRSFDAGGTEGPRVEGDTEPNPFDDLDDIAIPPYVRPVAASSRLSADSERPGRPSPDLPDDPDDPDNPDDPGDPGEDY